MHISWHCRRLTPNLVCQTLVIAYCKPRFPAVGCVGFQYQMQLFYMCFCDFFGSVVDNVIDTTEMVYSLHYIVNVGVFGCYAYGVSLKNQSSLLLGEATALNMFGVVCQIYLDAVINAAFHTAVFLFTQTCKQF